MEKALINNARALLQNGEDIVTARIVRTTGSSPRHKDAYMIISSGGSKSGTVGGGILEVKTEEICRRTLEDRTVSHKYHFNLNTEGKDALGMACGGEADILIEFWDGAHPEKYIAPPVRECTAFIFGGGHVSQALDPVLRSVDFRTVILDDRAEFAGRGLFPAADEVIRIDSYEDAFADISVDEESYIVIVTHGHMGDYAVLHRAVDLPHAYIGMIGSRRKTAVLFDRLREDGIPEDVISKIYAPVGEKIYAETPAEIAVSIAAEMIKVRSGHGTRQ